MSAGWKTVRIGEVAVVNPGRHTPHEITQHKLFPFIPMSSVDEVAGTITVDDRRPASNVESGHANIRSGDVVFAKITPCMQNGKSAVYRSDEEPLAFGSTEFHVIRANPSHVLPEWIWHNVREQSFLRRAMRSFRGSGGQKRVPAEFLRDAEINLPPLDEQRRISARIRGALERVEEIELLQGMQREDAARLLPSALSEVFARATSHTSTALGDVITDCRYGTSTKCRTEKDEVTVLRIPNVSSGALDLGDLKYCARSAIDDDALLADGDLLIIRSNGSPSLVGRSAVYREDPAKAKERPVVSFASYLIRLRFNAFWCLPEYARYFLASSLGRAAINRIRRSSAGQSNINAANIKAIRLPLPSVGEQRALVASLADIERASRSLADEANDSADTAQLRAAILRQAFSGKL